MYLMIFIVPIVEGGSSTNVYDSGSVVISIVQRFAEREIKLEVITVIKL